jgi:hypothetical protein
MRGSVRPSVRSQPGELPRRDGGRRRNFVPFALQGFGTTFVGKRDFWPDGSYVTTEWIVALFIPLVPLRSLRVRPGPQKTRFFYVAGSSERNYAISDENPPHRKQVACVYGFVAFYATWVLGLLVLLHPLTAKINEQTGIALLLSIVALPWIVPWCLRERAKHWRAGFK